MKNTTKKSFTPKDLGIDKVDEDRYRKWWTPPRLRRYIRRKKLEYIQRLKKMLILLSLNKTS